MSPGALRGHLRFGRGKSLIEVAILADGRWLCDTCQEADACPHVAWLLAQLRAICCVSPLMSKKEKKR